MLKLAILVFLALPVPAVTLQLSPFGGAINGLPGDTVGWGFTLTNDSPNWLTVTSSALTFETNPLLGVYSDLIGLQGGPVPFFALTPFSNWSQTFDGISEGAGAYAISAGATLFAQNTGDLLVNFDFFDNDPLTVGVQIASASVAADFTVNVSPPATVPEPSTLGLMLLGAGAVWSRLCRRRERR